MRLRIFNMVVIFLLIISGDLLGQKSSEIQGFVVDSNNYERIPHVTIQLFDMADSLQRGTVADAIGEFRLHSVPQGKYKMQVSCVGYRTKRVELTVDAPQKTFSIMMSIDTKMMEEVSVVGEKITRFTQIDRTVYRIDEKMLERSATAIDVLQKVPGITVNQATEEIRVHGNRKVLILVDGAYVKRSIGSISPEDIESIELITNPTAEYDSDVVNVINIVLKNDRKKGLRLFAMGRISYPSDYSTTRVGLDYGFSKFRIYASYMTFRIVNRPESHVFDSSYYAIEDRFGTKFERLSSSCFLEKGITSSHLIQYGLEGHLSEKDLLSLNGNFIKERNRYAMSTTTNYVAQGSLRYFETDTTSHRSSEPEQNYSLYYRHKFDEKGHEMSLNSNFYVMRGDYYNGFKSVFDYVNDDKSENVIMIRNLTNSLLTWNTKLKYDLPFAKHFKLTTGLQSYVRKINYTINNGIEKQYFLYHDLRMAVFGQLKFDITDGFSMTVGLRTENLSFRIYDTISRRQMNCLPNATAFYKFGEKHTVSLHYNTYLTYPSYHYLSPFVYSQTDSLVFSSGNPMLLPEKAQKIGLKYTFQNGNLFLETQTYLSIRKDLIGEKRIVEGAQTYSIYQNLEGTRKIGGNFTVACEMGPIGLMLESDLGYSSFKQPQFNGLEWQIGGGVEINLPLDLSLEVLVEYNGITRQYNGYGYESPLIESISLSRSFLGNRLFTELSFNNIFLNSMSESVIYGVDYYSKDWSELRNPSTSLLLRYVIKTGDRKLEAIEEKESLMESESNAPKRN